MNPINSAPNAAVTPTYSIDQILQATQPPKKPSGFRRVLGSLVGGVGNMFAPGIGGLIGNAISGGALSGNSISGLGGLGGISSIPGVAAGVEGQTMQMLQLQAQMAQEQEVFETVSSVMKSRHDASMAAIRNIS
jgi:hypothetical protein